MFKLYQRCSVFIEFMFRGWTKIAQQFNEILGTDIDKAKIRKKYEAEKKKEKVKDVLLYHISYVISQEDHMKQWAKTVNQYKKNSRDLYYQSPN